MTVRLRDQVRPVDVINTVGHDRIYTKHGIAGAVIKGFQLVCRPRGFWESTHSRLYLRDDRVLSVTDPVAKWEHIAEVEREDWRVLRPSFGSFTNVDVDWMIEWAELNIIGRRYDYLELVTHLIGVIYPGAQTSINKLTPKNFVCSSGVRAVFEARRKHLEDLTGLEPFPRLFTRHGKKLYVEKTRPEHFDCSPQEFELTAKKVA